MRKTLLYTDSMSINTQTALPFSSNLKNTLHLQKKGEICETLNNSENYLMIKCKLTQSNYPLHHVIKAANLSINNLI